MSPPTRTAPMKLLTALLAAVLPALAPAREQPPLVGTLKFANNDRLSGFPAGFNADGHLVWEAPSFLHEPIPIRIDKVLELRLRGGQPPEPGADHQALVTLTNGDTIRGQLMALDDTHVTLETWYGGTLAIRRSMAAGLEVLRADPVVYSGPFDLEEWVIDGEPDAWTLQGGRLSSVKAAGIARRIDSPSRCRIGFDIAWRNSLRFRLLFFSDEGATSQPDNCYDLVCQRRFVYLRKRWRENGGGGSRIIGQSNIAELTEKEKVRMEFYIDRKAGTIALYIDGRKSHEWSDPDPGVGEFGNWLHFVSEDFYPLRISRLRVSPWKGELPEDTDSKPDESLPDGKGQLIRLQNGDSVIGQIGAITDGILAIKTEHCDVKIPVKRMRSLLLTSRDSELYEEPIRKKGDVRAWLRDGGRITFRLDAFTKNSLKGYSQSFGNAEFDLDAFSRLEFNIYEETFAPLRSESTW